MGVVSTLTENARWEVTRLRRSRRIWLLLVPPIAGPTGSAIADVYLRVNSAATAAVLGIFITGGLAALVLLDLVALTVGEDLALRTHYLTLALPQARGPALGGRLLVTVGGSLGAYGAGAAAVGWIARAVVITSPTAPSPIVDPVRLAVGMIGLLVFLGGVAAAAAEITRTSSQAIVAGVLAGVVAAAGGSLFLLEGRLTELFPLALALGGGAGFAWTLARYGRSDA